MQESNLVFQSNAFGKYAELNYICFLFMHVYGWHYYLGTWMLNHYVPKWGVGEGVVCVGVLACFFELTEQIHASTTRGHK